MADEPTDKGVVPFSKRGLASVGTIGTYRETKYPIGLDFAFRAEMI